MPNKPAHVIVVGNEKGGAGKSTIAMHLLVSLLHIAKTTEAGATIGSIDLDARQATLSRYIENRRRHSEVLQTSEHVAIVPTDNYQQGSYLFQETIERMRYLYNVIVIDTPGSDHPLSRLAHSYADTLITPVNDSFVDLDVLALVDSDNMRISRPGHYSEMVWESRKIKIQRGIQAGGEWFVLRNRLSPIDARNKREMKKLLQELAKRIGFHFIDGLSERVIYREMFLDGLTLLDLGSDSKHEMNLSHVAARQELRHLTENISLAKMLGDRK